MQPRNQNGNFGYDIFGVTMKALIVLPLCGLLAGLFLQDSPRTFTSPDGAFQFKYSSLLIHCTPERTTEKGFPVSWSPADSCLSQDGICDDSSASVITIACFAYPKDKFKEKPEFAGSAFFVGEVPGVTTSAVCLEGTKDWLIHDSESAKIGSVDARLFHVSDAWMSGGQTGDIYRVFHRNKCYELGLQEASASTGSLDPGTFKEFTKQDEADVQARLNQPIRTFTFLN